MLVVLTPCTPNHYIAQADSRLQKSRRRHSISHQIHERHLTEVSVAARAESFTGSNEVYVSSNRLNAIKARRKEPQAFESELDAFVKAERERLGLRRGGSAPPSDARRGHAPWMMSVSEAALEEARERAVAQAEAERQQRREQEVLRQQEEAEAARAEAAREDELKRKAQKEKQLLEQHLRGQEQAARDARRYRQQQEKFSRRHARRSPSPETLLFSPASPAFERWWW